MPHKKGHILPHNKNQKTQDKYNYLADRAADMILQYYPDYKNPKYGVEDIGYHKLSPVMTGPTFQARHPELAKDLSKYTTHYGRLVPYLKDGKSMLETIPAQPIPNEINMELKGGRIPQPKPKLKVKPFLFPPEPKRVKSYDRIIATINPYNLDDSKYGGNKYTDVSFFELNSTTGEKTFIGNWEDDFETHPSQPGVNFRTSTGEPIRGMIEEVMDSLYRANPQNIIELSEDDRSHPSTYQSSSAGRSPSSIRGEAIDKKTGMPKQYEKGGYVNKYVDGGEVIFNPYEIDPFQSDLGQGDLITATMNYDNAASMGQSINLDGYTNAAAGDYAWDAGGQDMVTEQSSGETLGKLGDVAAVGLTAYEVGSDYKEGVRGYKEFYEENYDPRTGYDSDAALKNFKEARAQKYGAAAEAVGFTLGTVLTGGNVKAGRLVGNIAEKFGEGFSKLFGVGKKAKRQMEERETASLTYEQSLLADEAEMKQRKKRQETLSKYISELGQPAQVAYAELGGMLYGPSHAQGGIPIEAEGGEFIVKKSAMNDNKVKTITGTNKQIASKINADAGGKNPFPGAKLNIYG